MNKKIILSIVILITLALSLNQVFATNMIQDATNTMTNSINKTSNTMQDASNAVMDAGNSVMNATNNVINDTMDAINNITEDRNTDTTPNNNNTNNDTGMTRNDNNNYNATRTSAEGTLLGMNSTTWTWIVMGLVALAIVALVWYYSAQTSDKGYDE